jgi:hypothetical protein
MKVEINLEDDWSCDGCLLREGGMPYDGCKKYPQETLCYNSHSGETMRPDICIKENGK